MGLREEKLREFCRSARGLAHVTWGMSVERYMGVALRGYNFAVNDVASWDGTDRETCLDAYRTMVHQCRGMESDFGFWVRTTDYLNAFENMRKGESVSDEVLAGIELLCQELNQFGLFDIERIREKLKVQGDDGVDEKGKFDGGSQDS